MRYSIYGVFHSTFIYSLLRDTQVLEELRKEHSFSLMTDVKDGSGDARWQMSNHSC